MSEIPVVLSRETKIRRDAEGRWFDGVEPIDHPGIIKAFESWLDRAEDGRFILKNTANWAYVAIEGAPILVRRAWAEGDDLQLELSGERREPLAPETLRQDHQGRIYCDVRGGQFVAVFSRQAGFDLGERIEEGADGPQLCLGERRYTLPIVSDPLAPIVTDLSRPSM